VHDGQWGQRSRTACNYYRLNALFDGVRWLEPAAYEPGGGSAKLLYMDCV